MRRGFTHTTPRSRCVVKMPHSRARVTPHFGNQRLTRAKPNRPRTSVARSVGLEDRLDEAQRLRLDPLRRDRVHGHGPDAIVAARDHASPGRGRLDVALHGDAAPRIVAEGEYRRERARGPRRERQPQDRKSTRLNSSHLVISYAVFCLKKKKTTRTSSLLNSS